MISNNKDSCKHKISIDEVLSKIRVEVNNDASILN